MDHSPFPRAVRRPAGRPAEAGLLWAALALLALALFGPALPASAHQHGFADQRTLWGVPCAMPGRVTARVQNGAPGQPQPTGGACRPGA